MNICFFHPLLSKFDKGVCGDIVLTSPIIRCIKEGLISNKISKLIGILNGTSNYILSRMEQTGKNFKYATFNNVDLSGKDLSRSDFSLAKFDNANLENSIFHLENK